MPFSVPGLVGTSAELRNVGRALLSLVPSFFSSNRSCAGRGLLTPATELASEAASEPEPPLGPEAREGARETVRSDDARETVVSDA